MTFINSWWGWATIAGAFFGLILGCITLWDADAALMQIAAGGIFGAGTFGGIVLAIALIDRRTRNLDQLVRAGTAEARAMTNIRPLFGALPLNVDGWALAAETCERIVHEITTGRPSLIVECGSGTSTLLMATRLKTFGIDGRVVAIDHDATYAEKTRDLLRRNSVDDVATVVTAPITSHTVRGDSTPWYDFDPEQHLDQDIDLLLVDGPPSQLGSMMRYPALPILQNHLTPESLILLDDGHREDEQLVVDVWKTLGYDASLNGKWSPYWILRAPARQPAEVERPIDA